MLKRQKYKKYLVSNNKISKSSKNRKLARIRKYEDKLSELEKPHLNEKPIETTTFELVVSDAQIQAQNSNYFQLPENISNKNFEDDFIDNHLFQTLEVIIFAVIVKYINNVR